jgi:hypothetical protein
MGTGPTEKGGRMKQNRGFSIRKMNIVKGCLIAAVVFAMAAAPATVQATGYRVETATTNSVTGSAIPSSASYNYAGYTGAFFYQPYPGPGNTDTNYSTVLSGTQDLTGTAKSSWDSASSAFKLDPQYNPQVPATMAASYAAADLASGTVRASATVTPGYYGNGPYAVGSAGATARAIAYDTLLFTNSNTTASVLTVSWIAEGSWDHLTLPDGSSYALAPAGKVSSFMGFGNGQLTTEAISFHGNNYIPGNATVTQSGWTTADFVSTDAMRIQFTGTYTLNPGVSELPIYLGLNMAAYGDRMDFSNTGKMGLVLPDGVSFTSDSGVFMTPEPATLLLLGLGFGGLTLTRRRQK